MTIPMATVIYLIDGQQYQATEDFENVWMQVADNEVISVHVDSGELNIPKIFIQSFGVWR